AKACTAAGASLVPAEPNPLDAIWEDRPPAPLGAVVLHDQKFSGEPAAHKLERIRAEIAKLRADALVVSDPAAVCWTFNSRGADVAHTPLALAFAIVPREGRPSLYIDGRKLGNPVRPALSEFAELNESGAFARDLKALGGAHRAVRLDPSGAADAIQRLAPTSGGPLRPPPAPLPPAKAGTKEAANG